MPGLIMARPLVGLAVGVEEVRRPHWSPETQQPWTSWASWHRRSHGARPLDVGLRHATGLHGPLNPRTLPCLTLGWTIGLWPAPRWAASWGCAKRWNEKSQCNAVRQNSALEALLLKKHPEWQHGQDYTEQQPQRKTDVEATTAAAAAATIEEPVFQQVVQAELQSVAQPSPPTDEDIVPVAVELVSQSIEVVELEASRATCSESPPTPSCSSSAAEPLPPRPSEPLEGSLLCQAPRQPLEPLVLDDVLSEEAEPHLQREDSEWSFLSHSLHTVDSIELDQELDFSDDDRLLPDVPRWVRMRNYFWWPQSP